jgi:hypothetical protein
MSLLVTRDEHVVDDVYQTTRKWQIREIMPDGSSELVDCCLTKQEAITGARYQEADANIEIEEGS